MGKNMEKVRDMLCEELDNFGSKGELTAGSLDTIQKLTHSIKSIDTIMAMEDAYSNEMGGSYEGSYGSYRGGGSRGSYGERSGQRRDGRGRYSRARGRSRGYSYDDAKDEMVEQLEDIMQTAPDKKTKDAIRKAIEMMEE